MLTISRGQMLVFPAVVLKLSCVGFTAPFCLTGLCGGGPATQKSLSVGHQRKSAATIVAQSSAMMSTGTSTVSFVIQ